VGILWGMGIRRGASGATSELVDGHIQPTGKADNPIGKPWEDDPMRPPGRGELQRAAMYGGSVVISPKAASIKVELQMQDHTLQSLQFTRAT